MVESDVNECLNVFRGGILRDNALEFLEIINFF